MTARRESRMPAAQFPSVVEIEGGVGAPAAARSWVLSHLCSKPEALSPDDAALIVSELVTNSVVHANVDSSQRLTVSLVALGDGLRLTVTDPGSDTEPRLSNGAGAPGGFGLRLVDLLCASWGTARDPDRTTHVWCDLPRVPGGLS